jgi:hypothetical protein
MSYKYWAVRLHVRGRPRRLSLLALPTFRWHFVFRDARIFLTLDASLRERCKMSLRPEPHPKDPDAKRVMHGGLEIGSIHKSKMPTKFKQWIWSVNSLLYGPPGMRLSGVVGTVEEGAAAIRQNWDLWLEWADLSERSLTSGDSRRPQIVAVTISEPVNVAPKDAAKTSATN